MLTNIAMTALGAFAMAMPAAARPVEPLKLIMDNTTATMIEVLQYDTGKNFTILVDLIERAGLAQTVGSLEGATLFAPHNAAFESIPGWDTISQQLENLDASDLLRPILEYHILKTVFRTPQLAGGLNITLPTQYNNETVFIQQDAASNVTLVGSSASPAQIIQRDISSSQGTIQVINAILVPADSPLSGRLSQGQSVASSLTDALPSSVPIIGSVPALPNLPLSDVAQGIATPRNLPKPSLPSSTGIAQLDSLISQLQNGNSSAVTDLANNPSSLASSLQSIRNALSNELGGQLGDVNKNAQDVQQVAGSYSEGAKNSTGSIGETIAQKASDIKDGVASMLPNM